MKSIKPVYLFAVASYMLTQAVLLLLGSAFHFASVPSVMDFAPFQGSHFFMAWHFSTDGALSHMLFLWCVGTVLFAVILWLFFVLGGEQPEHAATGAADVRHEPAMAPDAPAEALSGADAEVAPAAEAVPQTSVPQAGSVYAPNPALYPPRRDDGTGLGIVSVICGCIGFIPGLGMLFAIAGIVCGVLGNMRASAVANGAGRALSVIGIALSAVSLFLMITTVLFLGSLFNSLFGTMV